MQRNIAPLVVLGMLAAATLSSVAGAEGTFAIDVPLPRVGAKAIYADADPLAGNATAFGFAWGSPEDSIDRWARPSMAWPLRTIVPSDAPGPDGAPAFDLAVDGFAVEGRADPVWRLTYANRTSTETTSALPFGLAPVSTDSMENITWKAFDPLPTFRSCLAHHGLQGQPLQAGTRVELATLCPAVERFGVVQATPAIARRTTFLGRDAIALAFPDTAVQPGPAGDLDAPWYAELVLVLADGLPFVADAQMVPRGATGPAWHYALNATAPGQGEPVPAWRSLEVTPGTIPWLAFAPLGRDGPADGGSGLPFTLQEALAEVRANPTLTRFHEWERAHPERFLLHANLLLSPSTQQPWGQQFTTATWTLDFALPAASEGDELETFEIRAKRDGEAQPTRILGHAVALDSSSEEPPSDFTNAGRAPDGEQAMDLASAVRGTWAMHSGTRAPTRLSQLTYDAPTASHAASFAVETTTFEPSTPDRRMLDRFVLFDASRGAELLLTHRQDVESTGPFDGVERLQELDPVALAATVLQPEQERPIETTLGPQAMELDAVQLGVVATIGASLLLTALAHGGYFGLLHARLRRGNLLDHPTRGRIYDLVKAKPGIYRSAIAHELGLGLKTTRYHLRVLERGDVLGHIEHPGYRRYYVLGDLERAEALMMAELQAGHAEMIYDVVRDHPGITLTQLARAVHISVPSVHRSIERLRDAGLVQKRLEGREVRLTVRDAGSMN
jgi:predicted transcriptional regulator